MAGRLDLTRQQVVVDAAGFINVPPLGTMEVGGLTVLDAQRRVAERARALFRFMDVALTVVATRSFEVVVAGEVERPATMLFSATKHLHEVVQAAGGITPRGSNRRIKVSQKGVEREVDLLRFELLGDVSQNPLVEEGMKIYVPPRSNSVTLSGAVRRPGEYELGPGGSLREILDLTGGLSQNAAGSDARLTRVGPDGRKKTFSVDLRAALARPADVTLEAGDALFVPSLGVLQDVVEVRGAFNGTAESGKTTTAGKATIVQRFELAQGERVRDLANKAGGAAAFADLRLAFVERTDTAGPRQQIPVDLHRLLVEKDDSQNVLLQNGDVLNLPVIEDKVYVVGEVKAPGGIDFRPNLTVRDYVALAGGPGFRAKTSATTVTFRDGKIYRMPEAPPLEPGAVVTVPEVSVKWWRDYVALAQIVTGLILSATGIFILFGAQTTSVLGETTR